MNMEILAQIVAVASAFAAAFHFAVLRPLDNTISRIEKMLDKFEERADREESARHEMAVKLAEVDQRARSAHARIDEITKILSDRNN
jgi:HAMP domain-containing protein